MRIITSTDVIQKTYSDIQKTIKELENLSGYINSVNSKLPEWTDEKSEEFKMIMDRIAKLTVQPNRTLLKAVNAMKKMELAMQKYNSISFN